MSDPYGYEFGGSDFPDDFIYVVCTECGWNNTIQPPCAHMLAAIDPKRPSEDLLKK